MLDFDDIAGSTIAPASADASFRRYFRVQKGDLSRVVMDAPPEKEDSLPFVQVASFLEAMNLHAPRVFAADLERGFLLLTDLGSTQFLEVLQSLPDRSDELYADAIAALVTLQREGGQYCPALPEFDDEMLRDELSLFSDWLCGTHLGIEFSDSEWQHWQTTCDLLVTNALEQPSVFVHRDYHSRNLMLVDKNNPGILDFQDAVAGPYTYDLVSLLKDCYIAWPEDRVQDWALSFFRTRQNDDDISFDEATFIRHFELMGVQRQLKAAGIFARLNHRDGKPAYMLDIPRTLTYVLAIAHRYEELRFVAGVIRDNVLPRLGEAAT